MAMFVILYHHAREPKKVRCIIIFSILYYGKILPCVRVQRSSVSAFPEFIFLDYRKMLPCIQIQRSAVLIIRFEISMT